MSDRPPAGPSSTRASQRIPLETRVRLEFDHFQGFVEEYSSNLSLGGMFVRTDDPQPPGTLLEFELRLQEDEFILIQGSGEVVWVRERGEGESLAAGMGIRFRELDPRSEDLIIEIVRTHLREGGKPFELYPLAVTGLGPKEPPASPGRQRYEVLEVPDLDELFSEESPAAGERVEPIREPEAPSELADEATPPAPAGEVRDPEAEPTAPTAQTDKEIEAVSELRRFLSGSKRRRRRRRFRILAAALLLVVGAAGAALWQREQAPERAAPSEEPVAALAPSESPPVASPEVAEPLSEPEPPPPVSEPEAPAALPEPIAETPEPVSLDPATALEEIAWEEEAGEFRLRLRGNGRLAVERTRRFRLDGDNPRELLQVRGIEQPYREAVVPVASALVTRIRTGFHQRPAGPELHIVLDLAREDLPVARVEQQGPEAVLLLARE